MNDIVDFIEQKERDLILYSPYKFLPERHRSSVRLTQETMIKPLLKNIKNGSFFVEKINEEGHDHFFVFRKLAWDSDFFSCDINKIEYILYDHYSLPILSKAIKRFLLEIAKPSEYYFIDIPSEEILLIQALNDNKFKLIETRLNYYLNNINHFDSKRYNVRKATIDDIQPLRQVAIKMRNRYDRVHADFAFNIDVADAYLGKYIEESIMGFADIVLVPDIPKVVPFGFLALNKPRNITGIQVAKLVLAAVDNTHVKGWLYNLLTEAIYELKNHSTEYITTITQASNNPAIKTWEKAGFKLGFITHIFSLKNWY